jgi:hypothetical protein
MEDGAEAGGRVRRSLPVVWCVQGEGESMGDTRPTAVDPGQAIQKVSPSAGVAMTRGGVALANLDDLLKFARMCTENGAAPKGMNHQQAAVAIQAGLERGMGIMASLQAGVVINGVLSWRGWAVIGLIQNSPVIVPGTFKTWVDGQGDDRTGYCQAQRKGYSEPFIRKFSVKDAKLGRLWTKGGPWDARPDNMLEWRAVGDMGRFHFGDVLGGIPIAEELESGYGPLPGEARELPSEARPAPPSPVRDPILAELVPGPPEAAAGSSAGAPERRGPDKPNPTGAMSTDRRGPKKSPETQAVIDAQVDEVFDPPKDFGDKCPRCLAKLNAMAGCDVCGFPGTDNGERP